jgi:AmmeMemoRadiSam system protein B
MEMIRKPVVAGTFYPADENNLRDEIEQLLSEVEIDEYFENLFGIVAPHAGYKYSGLTAAKAYKLIENKNYETVIVISPSHREYFAGSCIYEGEAYQTPLGLVQINSIMRDKIISGSDSIFLGNYGHNLEHALEVQVPFLQTVLSDFKIVPIVMGDQNKQYVYDLAARLADVVDEKTLIVASSDLSHFHNKQQADLLDSRVEQSISDFDYEGLLKNLEFKNCEACGGGPIAAMMKAAEIRNRTNSKIIARSDSGDVTGDDSEVVGYLSAIIY